MMRFLRATIGGLRTTWWYLAALIVVLAVMAAGVHTMTIAATPARAWQERVDREADAAAERAVVPNPAASEGLPIPALLGGIVLAFAVGLTAGQVQRRRRSARREAALLRPDPVPDPVLPARAAAVAPAPAPPAPKPRKPPKIVNPAPPPPPPPPPPPEPKRRKPEPKPPEPVETPPEPVETPPEAVESSEPVEASEPVAALPEPAEATEPVAAPPEPDEPSEPVAAPPEPDAAPEPAHRIVPPPPVARPRPPESALGGAPEVPRREKGGRARREPDVSLDAPESIGGTPRRAPSKRAPARRPAPRQPAPPAPIEADVLPGRRFARDRPWPEEAETLWTCEIAWKAGYVKSTFRAMAGPPGVDGRRKPIGESPSLRWTLMTDPEPPTPEMVAGVKALIGALVAAGWERTEPGGAWYAQRFLWRGEGEPGPVEVPEPTGSAEPPPR